MCEVGECVCVCVCVHVCVCVCMSVPMLEREGESVCVCVCANDVCRSVYTSHHNVANFQIQRCIKLNIQVSRMEWRLHHVLSRPSPWREVSRTHRYSKE